MKRTTSTLWAGSQRSKSSRPQLSGRRRSRQSRHDLSPRATGRALCRSSAGEQPGSHTLLPVSCKPSSWQRMLLRWGTAAHPEMQPEWTRKSAASACSREWVDMGTCQLSSVTRPVPGAKNLLPVAVSEQDWKRARTGSLFLQPSTVHTSPVAGRAGNVTEVLACARCQAKTVRPQPAHHHCQDLLRQVGERH